MNRPLGREADELFPAGLRVASPGEATRLVAAGPPAVGGVLEPGVEDVAASGDSQRDRVGRPPLVERRRVEEADAAHGSGARPSRSCRRRRAGRRMSRARLPWRNRQARRPGRGSPRSRRSCRRHARSGCSRSPGGSHGHRRSRAVVTVPIRRSVEPLHTILGVGWAGQESSEEADGERSMPTHDPLLGSRSSKGQYSVLARRTMDGFGEILYGLAVLRVSLDTSAEPVSVLWGLVVFSLCTPLTLPSMEALCCGTCTGSTATRHVFSGRRRLCSRCSPINFVEGKPPRQSDRIASRRARAIPAVSEVIHEKQAETRAGRCRTRRGRDDRRGLRLVGDRSTLVRAGNGPRR